MTFAADMAAFATRATARVRRAPGAVVSAIAEDLVLRTPVDTGELRASWQIAIGTGDFDAAPTPHYCDPSGIETIVRLDGVATTMLPGDRARFRNVAHYAGFVEYGTARMEPRAYMRGTMARSPAIAATVIARLAQQ